MRKLCLLILFGLLSTGIYSNNLFDETNSAYKSTIYPVGAQTIFDTEETINARQLSSGLPVNPGEPEPDPEPTPIGDIPFILFGILSVTYCFYRKNKYKNE